MAVNNIISDNSKKSLQIRIQHEESNNKIYTSMSNWLSVKGYQGAAKLLKKYAEDELVHKGWAVEFLLSLNILPIEPAQEQPQTEFKGLPQIIALIYQRELNTTEEVKELANQALKEGDMLVFGLAQKYVAEQVEEIDKALEWIDYLEQFGDSQVSLQLLDQKMGEKA